MFKGDVERDLFLALLFSGAFRLQNRVSDFVLFGK